MKRSDELESCLQCFPLVRAEVTCPVFDDMELGVAVAHVC
jgi:hypothetical protein